MQKVTLQRESAQMSLDANRSAANRSEKRPDNGNTTPTVKRTATAKPALLAVVGVGLLLAFMGIAWSLGWIGQPTYAPRAPLNTPAGNSAFSEEHPMGQKRNKTLQVGATGQ